MSALGFQVLSKPLFAFEAYIDGYFPMAVSIDHMMKRIGAENAFIELMHAPVMEIPDLPPDAPVPLKLRPQTAGLVERLKLFAAVQEKGVALSGFGAWQWLSDDRTTKPLHPMIRLAEPAYVTGFADTSVETNRQAHWVHLKRDTQEMREELLKSLGWSDGIFDGPFGNGISYETDVKASHKGGRFLVRTE